MNDTTFREQTNRGWNTWNTWGGLLAYIALDFAE